MAGPLADLKVVELSNETCAWAAKLLADLGADTVVIEPSGGSAQRRYGPFVADEPGVERSLWWWHYNTNKQSVVLDLDDAADRARVIDLIVGADVLIDGEPPGRLAALGLDHADLATRNPGLIHASITPFG